MNTKSQKGFTFLEFIIVVFVMAVGIGGAFGAIPYFVSQINYVNNRLTAAYLAQEGIEIIRDMRDGNFLDLNNSWDFGLTGCGSGCRVDYTNYTSSQLVNSGYGEFLKISGNFYQYGAGTDSKFTRTVTIIPSSGSQPPYLDVKVEVKWTEKGSHSIIAETYLYNYWPTN